ncbi:YeeE/YedE thiosulfate transporter family protein [Novipirellula sp. SH528]|uniref:YeeE/YedE thiosulfate transporter family protein n=1 Tax=Novipirellula sp. SH528 TaxID=3454466 RepID=UPI003FA1083E
MVQNAFTRKSWSPYFVGAAIGVLSWFSFITADHALGITTAFESTVAIAEQAVVPRISETNSFFETKTPRINWGWMLVVGVFVGAFISSKLSGDRNSPTVPPLWEKRFGPSSMKRFVGAFVGGLLMLLGARLAGGCTSGHGISGSLQLAASSWLFVIVAFSAGILTSFILFGREGRSHV